jgi:hypothetical protein
MRSSRCIATPFYPTYGRRCAINSVNWSISRRRGPFRHGSDPRQLILVANRRKALDTVISRCPSQRKTSIL